MHGLQVTLMIPWLAKCDQSMVFPNNMTFDTPEEQEKVRPVGSASAAQGQQGSASRFGALLSWGTQC